MYDYDWSRVEAIVRTWPAASGLGPAKLEAYVSALVYPSGRDRGARTDPLELEAVLLELVQEDMKGERPPIGVVVARIGSRRRASRPAELAEQDNAVSEPAPDWCLAHAQARVSAVLPLMLAAARRHGANLAPEHDEDTCQLCVLERLEAAKELDLAAEHGDNWRTIDEAREEWEAFERVCDEWFPWRVPS